MKSIDISGDGNFPLENYNWPRPHIVDEQDVDLVRRALNSDDWSHCEIARQFQSEFAKYIGSKYALLVPNGTSAIYLSLLAGGIKPGQEVIIPGITWPSVVYAVIKSGGIPCTADISKNSLCINAETILPVLSENTFAVIPTHLFGSQCEMQEICDLADARNVHVIEDAAQSIGSSQNGKKCGTWGLAGVFSLNDRKVLACGEGGCITTDNKDFYDELLRLQLILPERSVRPRQLPGTYKISEFQAAVALSQLGKLSKTLNLMEANATLLNESLTMEPSVHPQLRPESVDRQSYYSYCFNVDGISDIKGFRSLLATKLNLKISPPYVPLCDVSDFKPSQRSLSDEAARNLAVRHPNCSIAYHEVSARFPHYALRTGESEMEMIYATIVRVLRIFRN